MAETRKWLRHSVWMSKPLRNELDEAIKSALTQPDIPLCLSVLGVNFSEASVSEFPPGVKLESTSAPTGRWLAFGAMTSQLIRDISSVSPDQAQKIGEAVLQRLLGAGGELPSIRLRRWRGNSRKGGES